MGDLVTLAKARRELEDLYLGVPDDSVNLTFQDLAEIQQHHAEKKKSGPLKMDPISESTPKRQVSSSTSSSLSKLPSLDFSRALEASANHNHHHHHELNHNHHHHATTGHRPHRHDERDLHGSLGGHHGGSHGHHHGDHHAGAHRHVVEGSQMGFDDMSHVSGMSMASMNPFQERGGRRRPGIPHSNICTICSVYIYMFRHRCLVCGRVYCRECLSMGMGEMTEGRKCVECLGRKFSPRYIQRAGKLGCWAGCFSRYPSTVKQQELKWAEKGPRNSGDNRYGRSVMMSRSRSPLPPRTPTRAHATSNPPSFVINSPYSPYSPTTHHIPL